MKLTNILTGYDVKIKINGRRFWSIFTIATARTDNWIINKTHFLVLKLRRVCSENSMKSIP